MSPTEKDQWRAKLQEHGLRNFGEVHWNATTAELYEHAVRRREGIISHQGPLSVRTGHHTGRSPQDKFIVREPSSEAHIWWDDQVNRPFSDDRFDQLHQRLLAYMQGQDVFVQDCYICNHPRYRIPVRVITETAWHSLFTRTMFIHIADRDEIREHVPQVTIIHAPHFHAMSELDGTQSEAFVIINFGKNLAIIGGTQYGGEIKKCIFTILNYLLPNERVLSMHCSANVGSDGDVAIFFGLSGTGKTTLSADPQRRLIGDDEHGWAEDGIFNFEGGCYAKVIRLSRDAEPDIYACTEKFGTILENVRVDRITRRVDLNDDTLTENTRAAYPIDSIPNSVPEGRGGHPANIIMLTCDAFGVLPPVAKLTHEQAMYHFLSGYTARVAGTERGVTEPAATFSACFGAPFLARPPAVYAQMLGENVRKYNVNCWLLDTGWTGGPYGVGHRIDIKATRRIVQAILDGTLAKAEYRSDPTFKADVPTSCPGVPSELLVPRDRWGDKADYDATAAKLVGLFRANFSKFTDGISAGIARHGL